MTETLSRHSVLSERHRALGSGLEDWNGMGTAWSYATSPDDEHDAVRERAGMFDMSPLKKVFVRGAHAAAVLDHLTTRDMRRIAPGASAYLSVLTDAGTIADDAIVSNNGGDEWMIVHGSGDTMALLQASATGREVAVEFTDDLHDISVQGPRALAVLNAACSVDLAPIAYFRHVAAQLFGHPCRISRTGYSGERGYEIFVASRHAGDIWDALADAGVIPCSFGALDKLRIEAGLLFYGYDMSQANTPWEVGLGFTINQNKTDFRGSAAVRAARGSEKVRNVGLDVAHTEAAPAGARLTLDGRVVGTVNSPCYSRRLGRSLALGHVDAGIPVGTVLTLETQHLQTTATVIAMPVHDPAKSRTHAP